MKRGSRWKGIPVIAAALSAAAASAQTSPTCQSALAALLGIRVAIEEAKGDRRSCIRRGHTMCTAEEGRIRELEQQLALVRNYVERYCAR